MRVCIDTNSLLPLFGSRSPFADIKNALLTGSMELAVSTAILLEYEEVITRLSGRDRWNQIAELFDVMEGLHGNRPDIGINADKSGSTVRIRPKLSSFTYQQNLNRRFVPLARRR